MVREAIDAYHGLLSDAQGAETQSQLDDQQRRRGLFFGDRPLCTVLRPRFLSPEQYGFLIARVRLLLRAFDTAYRAAMASPAFRAQFGLLDWEETLLRSAAQFREPSPVSRLDSFFLSERDEFWITEYNAETPAACAYNDILSEVFLGLPVMRGFLRDYRLRPLLARHAVLHALLDAYREWGGSREAPRMAILDWREVPTYSEFVLFQDYFRSQGLECVIADPREVEYRQGRLLAGNVPVTLIYKRVLLSELIGREGLGSPVVRAVQDGAVCMVNPFRCKVLHKKGSLAVLSDERNADIFSAEERQAIAAHIPWTRRVDERRTLYRGGSVDLIPFILEHRDRLVLKSNDEYGGKGIVLGWEVEPAAWEQAVLGALAEPTVVQERISLPREPYPSLAGGRVEFIDRMLDTDPFVFHGAYAEGCLTRLSTAALLNVTAGGGSTVPTFVVERR
ncbi:MAG: hypothetical protein E6H02_05960 [Bacillati bacterium ANGP1]|uniref:Circularly permuted type 2 ATP-grasp protein n=1 Tax=Candidatus Segetimicrobium genomatis TaxID=2569760 RepID=A0A537LWS2_9BACT|nr:MAG: hypothetical protein E6H02_05960 [Terrabacteria group bacterium ANGP1]